MNTVILKARKVSLALLVVGVTSHGHLEDYSGASPGSWGLMRLGRDLMRVAGADMATPEEQIPSGNQRVVHREGHLVRATV